MRQQQALQMSKQKGFPDREIANEIQIVCTCTRPKLKNLKLSIPLNRYYASKFC